MRIAFLASDKPRERELADAVLMGARKHGHKGRVLPLSATGPGRFSQEAAYDIACMVGVKSRELFANHWRQGIRVIYFDKGYTRHGRPAPLKGWEYWRIAIDAHQPTERLPRLACPPDRLQRLNIELQPWRQGETILIAGSSQKYHSFYELPGPTEYWTKVARRLHSLSGREVVYRPKPSWHEAVEIPKTTFSVYPETIANALARAHVMVTHGSNACFEALIAGVPTIALGPAVVRPISDDHVEHVEAPHRAGEQERLQLLANLAYWQWSLPEFASGEAWAFIGEQLHAQ